jgi:uncharacterized protein YbjT (DUF2867 family)
MELHGARVLAFGTVGAQGSGLVPAIEGRGATAVRAGRRGGDVVADLTDPDSVVAAARGVDAVALHVPLGVGTPDRVGASVAALRQRGLPVAVNLGSPVPPTGAPDPFGTRPAAEALLATGAAVVTPTAYLENHAAPWALGPIARGELVYPRPAEDVLAWIAAGDVGAAAVAALAAGVSGELLALAGAAPLTFDALAAELGAGLGRELVFRRVTAAEYGELLAPVLGGGAAAGVEAAYGAMPEEPNPLMAPDAAAVWARLGLAPTTARDWAATVLAGALGRSGAAV